LVWLQSAGVTAMVSMEPTSRYRYSPEEPPESERRYPRKPSPMNVLRTRKYSFDKLAASAHIRAPELLADHHSDRTRARNGKQHVNTRRPVTGEFTAAFVAKVIRAVASKRTRKAGQRCGFLKQGPQRSSPHPGRRVSLYICRNCRSIPAEYPSALRFMNAIACGCSLHPRRVRHRRQNQCEMRK